MDNPAMELVRVYLGVYDSYHNQKEVAAYSATTLYLAATAALFIGDPFWKDYKGWEWDSFLAALITLSFLAFLFVGNQLELRRAAGEIYRACCNLAAKWIQTSPTQEDLTPFECKCHGVLLKGFVWPKALHEEIANVVKSRKSFWWPRDISFAAMFLLGALAFARVLSAKQ